MAAQAALIVLCILWMLLCLRFYTMIGRENVGQRRAIAIAAGVGAGLIYLLGTLIIPLLKAETEEPPRVEQPEDIKVKGARPE